MGSSELHHTGVTMKMSKTESTFVTALLTTC